MLRSLTVAFACAAGISVVGERNATGADASSGLMCVAIVWVIVHAMGAIGVVGGRI